MLCFSLYSAQQAMQAAYKPLLDPLGLTYPQYLVMVALWHTDGQKVGELGASLGLATNTLTPLLKRIEAAGLITRQRDSQDERQVRVSLTEQGRTLEAQVAEVQQCFLQATKLDIPELITLRDNLSQLRDALQDPRASTKSPRR